MGVTVVTESRTTTTALGDRRVRILRLDRHLPEAWALMPDFLDRLIWWAAWFGQKNGESLSKQWEACFTVPSDTMAAWVAVEDGRIIGHLLAIETVWNQEKVVEVVHLALKPRSISDALQRQTQDELEAWARSRGCVAVMMVTRRHKPRAWRRRYGITLHRYVYRKEL